MQWDAGEGLEPMNDELDLNCVTITAGCCGENKLWGQEKKQEDHVGQGLSTGAYFAPARGHLAKSGDIFSCHNLVGGGIAPDIYWVEARDAAQHPTLCRTAPTTKEIHPRMSGVGRLRNPELGGCCHDPNQRWWWYGPGWCRQRRKQTHWHWHFELLKVFFHISLDLLDCIQAGREFCVHCLSDNTEKDSILGFWLSKA